MYEKEHRPSFLQSAPGHVTFVIRDDARIVVLRLELHLTAEAERHQFCKWPIWVFRNTLPGRPHLTL